MRTLAADRQGSIIATADCSGNQQAINTYDEYGVPAAANVGRFQYTGQAWIPELGMYYYKARIYAPTLGRFMQTDPVGYKDQVNLYAYAGDDPVNGSDPSGDCTRATCGGDGGFGLWTEANDATYNFGAGQSQTAQNAAQPQTAQNAAQPQTAQNAVRRKTDAQNTAMNDPNLQPGAHGARSHCSEATCQIARAVGANTAPLGPSRGGFYNANTQVANLAQAANTPGSGWHATNLASAQKLANDGSLVIIGWANPRGGSGHTVTVMSDPANNRAATNPTVAQVGGSTGNGAMGFRSAFSADKRGYVQIYVYTGN